MVVCLGALALAAGCASAPKQTVSAPVYSEADCRSAVKAGTLALIAFSREHALSQMEDRAPDYADARASLAAAVAMLAPEKQSPSKPQYEQAAQCLESALAAEDRIVAARKRSDTDAESLGWALYDQSARDLLLALEPHAGASVKGGNQ
jgi:hypothetical protein